MIKRIIEGARNDESHKTECYGGLRGRSVISGADPLLSAGALIPSLTVGACCGRWGLLAGGQVED